MDENSVTSTTTPCSPASRTKSRRRRKYVVSHWLRSNLLPPPAYPGVPLRAHGVSARAIRGHGVVPDAERALRLEVRPGEQSRVVEPIARQRPEVRSLVEVRVQ